jgi:hypothetical protein
MLLSSLLLLLGCSLSVLAVYPKPYWYRLDIFSTISTPILYAMCQVQVAPANAAYYNCTITTDSTQGSTMYVYGDIVNIIFLRQNAGSICGATFETYSFGNSTQVVGMEDSFYQSSYCPPSALDAFVWQCQYAKIKVSYP